MKLLLRAFRGVSTKGEFVSIYFLNLEKSYMDLLLALQENGTLKILSPWSQMLWRHMARGICHIQHIP